MPKGLRRTAAFTALWRTLTAGSRGGPPLGTRLAALPRMIRASMRGEYDGGLRVAMMGAATAYVVSPIDVVPEGLLLLLGLADDVVVGTWLAGAVLGETERFLEWEKRRRAVIPGQARPGAPQGLPHRPQSPAGWPPAPMPPGGRGPAPQPPVGRGPAPQPPVGRGPAPQPPAPQPPPGPRQR